MKTAFPDISKESTSTDRAGQTFTRSEKTMFGEIRGLIGRPVAFGLFLKIGTPFLAADFR